MDVSFLFGFLNIIEPLIFLCGGFITIGLLICEYKSHIDDKDLIPLLQKSDFVIGLTIISTMLMRYGLTINNSNLILLMAVTWIAETCDLCRLIWTYK